MEKYLKGYLAWRGRIIPRIHDLEELQRLCLESELGMDFGTLDLAELTGYAVELRYDTEFWPSQPTASEAVRLAERVRGVILARVPESARP